MGREVRELYMERQKARLVMCQWGTSKGLVHGERARPLLTRVDPLLSVQMALPDSHLATWCAGTCILHIARKLDFQTFAPAYVLPATMYSWYIIHNSTFYSGWKLLRRYDIVCQNFMLNNENGEELFVVNQRGAPAEKVWSTATGNNAECSLDPRD